MTQCDTPTDQDQQAAWRLECEARWVLTHTLEWRQEYLARVLMKRGQVATDKLKAEIRRLWNVRVVVDQTTEK